MHPKGPGGWAWVWLLSLYVFFDVLNVFLKMFPIAHLFIPGPISFALSSILVIYISSPKRGDYNKSIEVPE
jgi:hypothetical protein